MPDFYLSWKAKADMRRIGEYTKRAWGRKQRNKYLAMIDGVFHDVANNPLRERRCDDVRQGYRKIGAGKHIVFYHAIAEDMIEIARVLHERIDVERQLSES